MNFSTELTPELLNTDELRALNYTLRERQGSTAAIPQFIPRLDLQDPADPSTELIVPAYAVIAAKGDSKSVYKQELFLKKKRGTNTLYYSGAISFPEGRNLSTGEWYMMLLINHQSTETLAHTSPSYTSGRSVARIVPLAATWQDAEGREQRVQFDAHAPFVSNWVRIAAQSGNQTHYETESTLLLKPEGTLLQHELIGDVAEDYQLRAVGIQSNTLSFRGAYNLSPEALSLALSKVSGGNDRQVPEWIPYQPKPLGLERSEDLGTLGTSPHYPWAMPSILQPEQHQTFGQKVWSSASTDDSSEQIIAPLALQDGKLKFWNPRGRQYLFFWGMPKPLGTGQKPYTYLWADVAPKDEANSFASNIDPEALQESLNRANQVKTQASHQLAKAQQEERALIYRFNHKTSEEEGNRLMQEIEAMQSQLLKLRQDYDQALTNYEAQYKSWSALLESYIGQETVGRQKYLITYAPSNTNPPSSIPRSGRLYQIKGIISPPLKITEVIYKTSGASNYSMVEISNTAQTPIDLSHYAIVRLVAEGGRYRYRKADGSLSDQLSEAHRLPLSALNPNQATNNTHINQIAGRGSEARYQEGRYSHIIPLRYWAYSEGQSNQYPALSRFHWHRHAIGAILPLYAGQSILVGASGYILDPVATLTKSAELISDGVTYHNYRIEPSKAWFNTWLGSSTPYTLATPPQGNTDTDLLRLASNGRLRWLAALADNPEAQARQGGTLDLDHRSGLALVYTGGDRLRIVDTTVPIGQAMYGNKRKAEEYIRLLASKSMEQGFSLMRHTAVDYPLLPPYRTVAQHEDWIISDRPQPGYFRKTTSVRQQWAELFSLERTFLDPQRNTSYTTPLPYKQ